MKNVIVIGAGPTGLFACSLLLANGYSVDLYDQKNKAGRKLLLAGKSGLNITNNKDIQLFSTAYGSNQKRMLPPLTQFSPSDLIKWLKELGIETYTGSTGLVFTVTSGAENLLSNWMESLLSNKNFKFHPGHILVKTDRETLYFKNSNRIISINAPLLVMGLGGASYPETGSDGNWSNIFKKIDLDIIPFKSMNCGFECSWSTFFINHLNQAILKNIQISYLDKHKRGEATITPYGIEGSPIYHFSREIRDSIDKTNKASVFLDLKPDLTVEEILFKLNQKKKKNSLSNHLRKQLNLSQTKILLLRELTQKDIFDDFLKLAKRIKKLPLVLKKARPIKEAISSSGGIAFKELDNFFMLKKHPGWFTAGEMVDWDAPTGGYLLQGCFSTAYMAVEGIKNPENIRIKNNP